MFSYIRLLLILIMAACSNQLFAEQLELKWYKSSEAITGYAEYLVDHENTLTFEQISDPSLKLNFQRFDVDDVAQGIDQSSYWFKFSVYNPRGNGVTWVIYPSSTHIDALEVWVKNSDTTAWEYKKKTDLEVFSARDINYRFINSAFKTRSRQSAEVYVRLTSTNLELKKLNVFVSGQSNLRDILAIEYMLYGVYYGLFLALALLIVSIWLYAPAYNYQYYFYFIGYLAANIMTWLAVNGFGFQFIWPNNPELHNQSLHPFYLLLSSFAILFAREILNLSQVSKKLDRVLLLLVCTYAAAVVFRVFGIAYDLVLYLAYFSLLSLLVQPLLAWYCYKQNKATYLVLYAVAWLPYCLSIMLFLLTSYLAIDFNAVLLIQFSILFECLLLIIATLSKMKFRAKKLELLSLQDPLTKLGNRRLLEEHILSLKNTDIRCEDYWILLIDIDHFKQVNDKYGHGFGDEVLVQLSKLMSKACRSDDLAIRWGGEEFLLLIKVDGADSALAIADRIRIKFSNSAKDFNGEKVYNSISVGISKLELVANKDLDDAVANADLALYQAKSAGRNQCIQYQKGLQQS